MDNLKCSICGYTYDSERGDEEHGILAGTKWSDLPESWACPVCNVGKEEFHKERSCAKCA